MNSTDSLPEFAASPSSFSPRDFVGPGSSASLLDLLDENERGGRLLKLVSARRRLAAEAPELGRVAGFFDAYQTMMSIPSWAVDRVVRYPGFGRWVSVLTELLKRDAHVKLPAGHTRTHLAGLGRYVLSAAALAKTRTEVRVLLDPGARICLAGSGKLVQLSPDRAGLPVECSLEGPLLRVASLGRPTLEVRLDCEDDSAVVVIPRAAGIELNDNDPDVAFPTGTLAVDQLTTASVFSWQTTMTNVFRLLKSSPYLPELERFVTLMIPLRAPSDRVGVSNTSSETFPMIQLSWHPDADVVAETLVHEYHHNKLNALMARVDLLNDDGEAFHYSPWRDDPRPAHGMLHGIFAFQSVVLFRHRCAMLRPPGIDLIRNAYECARRWRQTMIAIDELLAADALTPTGLCIVDEVRARLMEHRPPQIGKASARQIQETLVTHRDAWNKRRVRPVEVDVELWVRAWAAAGGALRNAAPRSSRVDKPENAAIAEIARALGVPQGVPVNRSSDARVTRDITLDRLGRLSVLDPNVYADLDRRIRALDLASPLAALFAAHADYVAGRFVDASKGYARRLMERPDNQDTWRFYAFALRHAGFEAEAITFLFRPAMTVAIASRVELDDAVFDHLCPSLEPEESLAAPGRLLRWLARGAQ